MSKDMKAESYWLHVDEHGVEHKLRHEREHESVFVEVKGDYEVATTRNAKFGWAHIGTHRPHGLGWEVLDAESDNFTVWRRRVRQNQGGQMN